MNNDDSSATLSQPINGAAFIILNTKAETLFVLIGSASAGGDIIQILTITD